MVSATHPSLLDRAARVPLLLFPYLAGAARVPLFLFPYLAGATRVPLLVDPCLAGAARERFGIPTAPWRAGVPALERQK
ncbi:MAG: hypothetical protein LBI96_04830 [Odoribacteraceae bacterium]|nr:hypothetical protein [Odoribacteraceae bacterium]